MRSTVFDTKKRSSTRGPGAEISDARARENIWRRGHEDFASFVSPEKRWTFRHNRACICTICTPPPRAGTRIVSLAYLGIRGAWLLQCAGVRSGPCALLAGEHGRPCEHPMKAALPHEGATVSAHAAPQGHTVPVPSVQPLRCSARTRTPDRHPCRKWALVGRTRCALHGGKSLSGIASPTFRHGRYSRMVSVRLAAVWCARHRQL